MLALDTNILIAAHRRDAPNHQTCSAFVTRLADGRQPFGLFWPSLYEFLRVVTHHRVFDPPSPLDKALLALDDFVSATHVQILTETRQHRQVLRRVFEESRVEGNLVHDAHLVALAIEHGVHQIITYDRDFKRFAQIESREPSLEGSGDGGKNT